MYRDMMSGKPLEADHIIGDLVVRAKQVNVPTPLLATAFAHLKVYQNQLPKE
jgi:2-dehydropantoate 2-reductase